MKILSNTQIREADAYTIINEPIASIDLMERAASQLLGEFISWFTINQPVEIFAGPGNNGGDGIALARMLTGKGYSVNLHLLKSDRGLSEDAEANLNRLPQTDLLTIKPLSSFSLLPVPDSVAIIVDALFGSGLTRPLDGFAAILVDHINSLPNQKVAVDIPSGLFSESNSDVSSRSIIKADYTWCFQFPKMAFLMPENEMYVGDWKHLDIGLHPEFIDKLKAQYYYITKDIASGILKPRKHFSHKGDFGHALLIAGSKGKLGAAILAGRSCLRSGAGLLTIHIPAIGMGVLQTAAPEAMVSLDMEQDQISSLPGMKPFSAVGIGPGIGQDQKTILTLEKLLESHSRLVLDADALNILAENPDLIDKIPRDTILTPHPGEYKRLFGPDKDHYTRLMRMQEIAVRRNLIIVLKGAHTAIACPDGKIFFNSTGNPGMATAGSGDVLTGIILSLLSQEYTAVDAAVLSVYLHGLAGDLGEMKKGQEGLIAGDIIDGLPLAFKKCKLR